MDIVRCQKCEGQFTVPQSLHYPNIACPSRCGSNLRYDSLAISAAAKKIPRKQFLITAAVNLPVLGNLNNNLSQENYPINLIVQYYKDSSRERQKELDTCLIFNASNVHITAVHILLEKESDFDETIFNNPKIKKHVLGERLKYSTALEFCNHHLNGQVCILANCDVYFDYTLSRINPHRMLGKALALSRYDVKSGGTLIFNKFLASVSQDAWIFMSPTPVERMNCNFAMGMLGCDNRIACEFAQAGYKVLNPCFPPTGIIVRHLHESEKRNYNETSKVKGNYLPVPPCESFE